MKRLLTLLLLAVLTTAWARADLGGYVLRHASIDIVAHENGCWDVTETLPVEFLLPRHGIYRYIPSKFQYGFPGKNGELEQRTFKTHINNVKVENYYSLVSTDDTALENTIVQIGQEDKFVTGLQTYVINYQVQYFNDGNTGEDFINHCIWGSGWEVSIDTLDFTVKFDKPLPSTFASDLHLYSGELGSTGNDDNVECTFDPETNTITGHVLSLKPSHAITISAKLPQGYWQAESKNNILFYLCAFITFALAAFILYRGFSYRRKDVIPVVTFYPPGDMSSAEVGKVIDGTTDPKDMASLIPWLAARGHITLEEVPDSKGRTGKHADLHLIRHIPLAPNAPEYLHTFMAAVFKGQKDVYVSRLGDIHFLMDKARLAVDKEFRGDRAIIHEDTPSKFAWFAMLLMGILTFATSHSVDFLDEILAILGGFCFAFPAFLIGTARFNAAPYQAIRTSKRKVVALVCHIIAAVFGLGLFWYAVSEGLQCVPKIYFLIGIAALFAVSYTRDRASIDTDYRVARMGELLGLKQFIESAEVPRLKMLVDEKPSYFYDVLPYAIVFGLSDKWSELFESIPIEQPDWYISHGRNAAMTSSLMGDNIARSMTESISQAVSSATRSSTNTSSSSGGGHSYSGGGGGGGGGGSW